MILAFFLTLLFVFMVFYCAVSVQRTSTRYILFAVYGLAIFFVWNPNQTTQIANGFGIGRGLDFVLIIFSVAILNAIFFIVRHLNFQHELIVSLARHIALQSARKPAGPVDQTSAKDR